MRAAWWPQLCLAEYEMATLRADAGSSVPGDVALALLGLSQTQDPPLKWLLNALSPSDPKLSWS